MTENTITTISNVGTSFMILYVRPDRVLLPTKKSFRLFANQTWNHVMPRTDAPFVQGQTIDQSTMPGVITNANPNTQLAIIAGVMIA